MASPFFSVIIPTYQRANVIQECVESVLDQTFEDFEVIVIDDGSTDNTREILEPMAAKDNRLRYIYQENAERSRARNHGIDIAQGSYICFLDSDDLFLPDHLERFEQTVTEHNNPVALFYCDSLFDGGQEAEPRPELKGDNLMELLMMHSIGAEQTCIHRSILTEHQFDPKIRIGEDRELWFRITDKHPMIHSDQRTAVVRDLGDRSVDPANLWAYYENIGHVRHLLNIDNTGRIPSSISNSMLSTGYFKLARALYNNRSRAKALYYVIRSTLAYPGFRTKYRIILGFNILGLGFLIPEHIRNEF